MNFERFGGRTFLLTVGCGVVTAVMRWFGHIADGVFESIIVSSVCAYIAKSGWDEHVQKRTDVQMAQLPPREPPQ
jgi:hypothetical protein